MSNEMRKGVILPKVHLIAQTAINPSGMSSFLKDLGAPTWDTDAISQGEYLLEVAGRSCYKSFGTELNKNVKRVRTGNENYIGGILNAGHGSVLEHSSATFAFVDVSRVFTHELVRHRAGAAYSQESLRFVRFDDMRVVWPSDGLNTAAVERCRQLGYDDGKTRQVIEDIETVWLRTMDQCGEGYAFIGNILKLDDCKDFGLKKRVTSAMRRLAPISIATTIIATYNLRALRHIIEMRTSPGAEEEIRRVFIHVAGICQSTFPAVFQDMKFVMEDEVGCFKFENGKI